MNLNWEILSLWVGSESQKAAHHFYSLQAQQFFDQSEDPTDHHTLWSLKNSEKGQKLPKMMIFDTKSDHLTKLRQVNHSKMLKKMKKAANQSNAFQFFENIQKQDEPQKDNFDNRLFENWECKESNYVLIETHFSQDSSAYDHWQGIYKSDEDRYQDKLRKRLETIDHLNMLNLCSDAGRIGYSNQVLRYFQQQCPKVPVIYTNLSNNKDKLSYSETTLPLISQISPQVSILIDVDVSLPHHSYFQSDFHDHFAAVYNNLLTPFILKDSNIASYFNQVCSGGKKSIFDLAYTLPVINNDNQLNMATNIFGYIPEDKKKSEAQQQIIQNRVNYLNKSFLNFGKPQKVDKKEKQIIGAQRILFTKQKVLTEAFVLKGHFTKIAQLCNQRISSFDIKYLQGIFAANPLFQLKYSKFYTQFYGQNVQSYPLHSVLYQHSAFGPSMRNYINFSKSQTKNEQFQQWKQGAIDIADLYSEQTSLDSD